MIGQQVIDLHGDQADIIYEAFRRGELLNLIDQFLAELVSAKADSLLNGASSRLWS